MSADPIKSPLKAAWISHPGTGLFLASFLALFLELLLIRWVPSLVRIMAYYGNLMLISSFLGLGCGMLLMRRRLSLTQWFAPLLLLLVLLVSILQGTHFEQGSDELRFLSKVSTATTALPVVFIFVVNVLLFAPLGELIGSYFERLAPLHAYSWDLGGAIAGTLVFGLFSYFWFSPILGLTVPMALYLVACSTGRLMVAGLFFVASLIIMSIGADKTAMWSPYNHIRVKQLNGVEGAKPVSAPPDKLYTMPNPPFYVVEVNRDFYMMAGAIDRRRYTNPPELVISLAEQYTLPHLIRPDAKEVLVVGSGGGMDVEAALLGGARSVDAVEIDPVIIRLGHEYNASQVYKDARVSIHNTDARAFFKQTNRSYDMIVFGFLDSQSLFSQMANVRLDAYVYTSDSLREVFRLLRPGGLLSISFFSAGQTWLVDRLVNMIHSASGTTPLVYARPSGQVVILSGKGQAPQGPRRFLTFGQVEWKSLGTLEATDNWPYLYLRRRFIPRDYLTNIGALLVVSLAFILLSSKGARGGVDPHFFLLGAGFLLLETKSITTISLYFGTTWFVSMVVILGILLMVLAANLVASQLSGFSLLFYVPLIASAIFLYLFPTQAVLAWPFWGRLLYSLTVIPLPIFFAGLIFSTTFRESRDPVFAFGSNLLGAIVGGFSEYLGMITGMKALLLLVLFFYLASFWVRLRSPGTAAASS